MPAARTPPHAHARAHAVALIILVLVHHGWSADPQTEGGQESQRRAQAQGETPEVGAAADQREPAWDAGAGAAGRGQDAGLLLHAQQKASATPKTGHGKFTSAGSQESYIRKKAIATLNNHEDGEKDDLSAKDRRDVGKDGFGKRDADTATGVRRRAAAPKSNTSKFTGLVVGTNVDGKVAEGVRAVLTALHAAVWADQADVTRPLSKKGKDVQFASLIGTFPALVKINTKGCPKADELRSSGTPDAVSLATLLVLHCLTTAAGEGLGLPDLTKEAPSGGGVAAALVSLANYRPYEDAGPVLSLWPMSLHGDGWLSRPHNLLDPASPAANRSIWDQLTNLTSAAKDCQEAQNAIKAINSTSACRRHFQRPAKGAWFAGGASPDVLTSSLNMALGPLLKTAMAEGGDGGGGGSTKPPNKGTTKVPEKKVPDKATPKKQRAAKLGNAVFEIWKRNTNNMDYFVETIKDIALAFDFQNANEKNAKETKPESDNATDATVDINKDEATEKSLNDTKNVLENDQNIDVTKNSTKRDAENVQPLDEMYFHEARKDPQEEEYSAIKVLRNMLDKLKQKYLSQETLSSSHQRFVRSTDTKNSQKVKASSPDSKKQKTTKSLSFSPTTNAQTKTSSSLKEKASNVTKTSLKPNTVKVTTSNPDTHTNPNAPKNVSDNVNENLENLNSTNSNDTSEENENNGTTWGGFHGGQRRNITGTHSRHFLDSVSYARYRDFIESERRHGRSLLLVPLWIVDDTDVEGGEDVDRRDPGRHVTGDLDPVTQTALLHALLTRPDLVTRGDEELERIVTSGLRLVTWALTLPPARLEALLTSALAPSAHLLYWQAARLVRPLEAWKKVKEVYKAGRGLMLAIRGHVTHGLLEAIQDGGLAADGTSRLYLDGLIGLYKDKDGKVKGGGSDRVLSSALAAVTLLEAWTTTRQDGRRAFLNGTGDEIRIAVNGLTNSVFAAAQAKDGRQLDNALMADPVKACTGLPSRFPANAVTDAKGQSHKPDPNLDLSYRVKGRLDDKQWAKLGGSKKTATQGSFTASDAVFRYWSSTAVTRAASLLALSQAANLHVEDKFKFN